MGGWFRLEIDRVLRISGLPGNRALLAAYVDPGLRLNR
jgi:hypothetical protein